jgi:hypothetical protein
MSARHGKRCVDRKDPDWRGFDPTCGPTARFATARFGRRPNRASAAAACTLQLPAVISCRRERYLARYRYRVEVNGLFDRYEPSRPW